jgi:MtN3 and saliva related transmembrane protein
MKETLLIITMWIVTICTYISYIPQIIKLFRTKKSEDLSITSWILWCVSSIANLIYSLLLGRLELIIASMSEFILISLVLFLSIYYNYRNKSRQKQAEERDLHGDCRK